VLVVADPDRPVRGLSLERAHSLGRGRVEVLHADVLGREVVADGEPGLVERARAGRRRDDDITHDDLDESWLLEHVDLVALHEDQRRGRSLARMCRNITELRGLEPPATREEVDAASRQFVRKVSGITKPKAEVAASLDAAALEIADITERLLSGLPPRRQPPPTLPPLRRPEVRERLGLAPFPA
jgi:hypothetical protein